MASFPSDLWYWIIQLGHIDSFKSKLIPVRIRTNLVKNTSWILSESFGFLGYAHFKEKTDTILSLICKKKLSEGVFSRFSYG